MYLVTGALCRVIMTVYTFDLLVICDALKDATRRGVEVELIADHGHTLTGATMAMVERLEGLRAAGIQVSLTEGVTGNSGIQHSKTLLCDEHVIVGSCNWTTSSRSNQEMSVLISLNDAALAVGRSALITLSATAGL